jgi:TetR/AcrR family transcriptional repressor of nem operon
MTSRHESEARFLDSALRLIRSKGYAATSVDELCAAAGLTKGSFFHHFKSKEDLAIAATEHFSTMADGMFASASYRAIEDPLERLLGYVDLRASLLHGDLPDYTCLLGTMVQETYETHPAIREACEKALSSHSADVAKDVAAAKRHYAPRAQWTAESVAHFIQATIQGAFVLAKAKQGPDIAVECLAHLRRYLKLLFPIKPLASKGK